MSDTSSDPRVIVAKLHWNTHWIMRRYRWHWPLRQRGTHL